MWDSVQGRIKRRHNNTHDVLTDIIDGKFYKEYCRKGSFLERHKPKYVVQHRWSTFVSVFRDFVMASVSGN